MTSESTDIESWKAEFSLPQENAQRLMRDFDWPEDGNQPPTVTAFESDDPALWTVEIYNPFKPPEDWMTRLRTIMEEAACVRLPAFSFQPVITKNWVEESQKLNQPIEIGRFFVFGAHARPKTDTGRIELELEGGLAFGTGSHATTKGCLKALSDLADAGFQPDCILDVGTGTAILAMAAYHLWPVPVMASDNDPVAIDVARENMQKNNVPEAPDPSNPGISLTVAEGVDSSIIQEGAPYDLVCANILMRPLLEMRDELVAVLAPAGRLVLSGILETQLAELEAAYEAAGLRSVTHDIMGEWAVLVLAAPKA